MPDPRYVNEMVALPCSACRIGFCVSAAWGGPGISNELAGEGLES
jgi:hypothetical protein